MASTVPAKSQPLHNFSLPYLKWRRSHSGNNNRGGRSRLAESSSPHLSPPQGERQVLSPLSDTSSQRRSPRHCSASRKSPMRDSAPRKSPRHGCSPRQSPIDESVQDLKSGHPIPYRNKFLTKDSKNSAPDSSKDCALESSTDRVVGRFGVNLKVLESDAVKDKDLRSNMSTQLQKNKIEEVADEGKNDAVQDAVNTSMVEADPQEPMPKTWNFRPRKPLYKANNPNGGGESRAGGSLLLENKVQSPQATHKGCESEVNGADKGKKQKFSVSLSKEEIADDIFAMTGSKASRRPKKRARTIRKTLDNLFPGLWLAWITPDSYKVSDNPLKP